MISGYYKRQLRLLKRRMKMDPTSSNLLWQATKDNKTVYLAATFHTGFSELPPYLQDILLRVNRVCLEMIPDRPMGFFSSIGVGYHVGRTAMEFISKREDITNANLDLVAERVVFACRNVFGATCDVETWKQDSLENESVFGPVHKALLTIQEYIAKRGAASSLEILIAANVRQGNIKLTGLEKAFDHSKLATGALINTITDCFNQMLESNEATEDWVRKLTNFQDNSLEAFKTGDFKTLTDAAQNLESYEIFVERYHIKTRNIEIAKKTQRYANKKMPILVAVGALHFTGEYSLLNILQNKGWTLQKL
jgi:uncharacterized protein YbaP (TraB family)